MSRTYRALATVAVVVTAADLVATVTFDPIRVGGWFSYAPLSPVNVQVAALLYAVGNQAWTTTRTIAPSIVGTFGVVVAAQGRHWVWIVVFTALGLLGLYGGSALFLLTLYSGAALALTPLAISPWTTVILQGLPAVAALIFVATTSRPARITSGHANP